MCGRLPKILIWLLRFFYGHHCGIKLLCALGFWLIHSIALFAYFSKLWDGHWWRHTGVAKVKSWFPLLMRGEEKGGSPAAVPSFGGSSAARVRCWVQGSLHYLFVLKQNLCWRLIGRGQPGAINAGKLLCIFWIEAPMSAYANLEKPETDLQNPGGTHSLFFHSLFFCNSNIAE